MRNKWWTCSLNHLEHQIVGNFFQNLHYNIFLKIMGKIFGWWKITLQGLQLTFQEYFESPFPHPGNCISYRSPAWWPQKKCRHTTASKFQGKFLQISNTIFSWKLWETNFVDGKSDWITSLGLQLISSRSQIPLRSQTLRIAFHIYVSKRWERGAGG